jgi:hypothetical protein
MQATSAYTNKTIRRRAKSQSLFTIRFHKSHSLSTPRYSPGKRSESLRGDTPAETINRLVMGSFSHKRREKTRPKANPKHNRRVGSYWPVNIYTVECMAKNESQRKHCNTGHQTFLPHWKQKLTLSTATCKNCVLQ